MKSKALSVAFGLILVGVPSLAAVPSFAEQQTASVEKGWGFDTSLDISSDLKSSKDSDHIVSTTLLLMPKFKISDEYSLTTRFGVGGDLTGEGKGASFTDGSISVRHKPLEINPTLNFGWSAGTVVPMNSDSIARKSFLIGVRASPNLSFSLADTHVPSGLKTLSGFYELTVTRRFYTYTQGTDGSPNAAYSLTHKVNLNYDFGKSGFSLGFSPMVNTNWSYEGKAFSDFMMDLSGSYRVSKPFSVSLGLNNSGDYYSPNGVDSAVSLFDQKTATVYTSVSYSF